MNDRWPRRRRDAASFNHLVGDFTQHDDLFLMLLHRFAGQGRQVSPYKSPTFAPAKFADLPEARKAKATSRALSAARERLLEAGKIKVVTEGPSSRRRTWLEVVA